MLKAQIEEVAKAVVEAKDAFLLDVSIRGERGGKLVEVFVDTDTGVSTELCAEISRALARVFDHANLLFGSYRLVVSSPGIDRPLKFARQYSRNIGRKLTLKCRSDNGIERVEGELVAATEEAVTLKVNEGTRDFTTDKIIEARVKPVW